MAVDPNIAMGYRGVELQNPLTQYGQVAAIQNAQNQNALAQFQLGSAQRAETKDIARTNALARAGTDDNAIANALLQAGDLKGYSEFLKTRRETQKFDVDLADSKLKQSRLFLENVTTPEQYIAWHEANHKDPILGPMLAARGVTADQSRARINAAIQQGPEAFAQLVNESKLGTEKFMELNKPQNITQDLGDVSRIVSIPGLGGAPSTLSTTGKEMTPGEKAMLPIRQQTANAATSQATTAQGRLGVERSGLGLRALQADPFNLTGAQAAFPLTPAGGGGGNAMAPAGNVNAMTPRPAVASAPAVAPAAPADTISGRQMPLGEAINKGITGPDLLAVIPKSLAGQVSAILEHRAAPPSGNTTRSSQLMQIVQAADPTYDAQQYKTKQGIETAFTAGLPSRTLKSINVADDHLKVLNSTIDALQNNDAKLFNQLGNTIATQFGAPAPTDFNGVKTIVADELVKAILGGAGALGDRKAIQETVSSANSPEQLRSMIKRYQQLMDGQRTGLADQYKSGGGNNANVLSLLNKNKPTAASATGVDTSNPLLK
jgi:hypothetical protein